MRKNVTLEGKEGVDLAIGLTIMLGNYNPETGIFVWRNDVVTSIYYERSDNVVLIYYGKLVLQSNRLDPVYYPTAWIDYIKVVRDNLLRHISEGKQNSNIPYGQIGPLAE